MEPFGVRLRRAREERGLSLHDVATETKISVTALDALERGDVARLPGGIYGRSFVRAYAARVELDPEEIVREFSAAVTRHERESSRAKLPSVVTADDREFLERQRRATRILRVVIFVLGAGLVGLLAWQGWSWWTGRGVTTAPAAGEVEAVALPAPPPVAMTDEPAAPIPPPPLTLSVTIDVTASCWIRATADGVVVFEEVLRAGARRDLRAERELVLVTGNAGAVRWTLNGRPGRPLGRPGERREVRVTPETVATFVQDGSGLPAPAPPRSAGGR